jgi:hypothetical protein
LVGVVVITVTVARAPASTIVVVGIVVVRHCTGFMIGFGTQELFKQGIEESCQIRIS